MRKKLVLEFFDRGRILNLKNKEYYSYIKSLFDIQLKEDIDKGDVTTNSLISKNKRIKAYIVAKQNGIVAGIEESKLLTKSEKVKIIKKDGSKVKNKDIILEIQGNARKIMGYERTLLNIMQRMSGIATLTYNTKKIVKGNCFIAATRKTLPHLIDKKAVSVGTALTHRLNLNDFILIKDNHLAILNAGKSSIFGTNFVGNDIEKALKLANKSKTKYIEIEVKNQKEALKAAKVISNLKTKKLFAILFDNMDALTIKNTIIEINNMINKNLKNKKNKLKNKKNNILFEASGNINEKNANKYSKTGVDVVSLGMLTHSAKVLDMSLEIK
ncbi:MAG: carboxylating nicotinate-nucleotide diphosphorylase [Nanoarchaeota archaeon]|nr:carboxylating nicotinate-nucleotide diphosphorylase [Nanoarchaeota archaeon]